MKILVTGAKGFVGKNLCSQLNNIKDGKARWYNLPEAIESVFEYDIDSTPEQLDQYCREADFVFNLAGVNRPKNQEEFMEGNFGFASTLLATLKKYGNTCPVMISSSIQATLAGRFGNSEYGRSKKAGEELMFQYGEEIGAKVLVYRFPNLFGKWCRPNYNSAVATFCNNIANDLPIQVNDPSVEMELLYIDDLVDEMIGALAGNEHHCEFEGIETILTDNGRYCAVPITHKTTLGEIVDIIKECAQAAANEGGINMIELPQGSLRYKLMTTYLSYLPKEKAIYDHKMNVDPRGSFTELVHSLNCGQVSINISKPGITKGEHWHHSKFEYFTVVSGHGLIQLRCLTPTSPQERSYYTADPSLYAELEQKAKDMRKQPTEAESAMWTLLRNNNAGVKFRRQHVIGDYIVDFVDLESGLIIEIDGGYHNEPEQKEADAIRTAFLQNHGYSVLRFSNEEVMFKPEEVFAIVRNALSHVGRAGEGQILNYFVSGDKIQSVIMLPGYTHNIINLSETEDLVTVMYCNEIFNPNRADTYFDKVVKD